MDLQSVFYVVAIVFMSLMLVFMLAIVIAVFVIKSKINAIQRSIEEKVHNVANYARIGTDLAVTLRKIFFHR